MADRHLRLEASVLRVMVVHQLGAQLVNHWHRLLVLAVLRSLEVYLLLTLAVDILLGKDVCNFLLVSAHGKFNQLFD